MSRKFLYCPLHIFESNFLFLSNYRKVYNFEILSKNGRILLMISAVIPLHNEEENLDILYQRLVPALKKIDKSYEIIFIDDGSIDSSLEILKKLALKDQLVRIYSFRKNLGKSEALTLGFQQAKGDYIVTLDADLQDRPEEIEKLSVKMEEGYDLVTGWRKNRQDARFMVRASKLFNGMTKWLWKIDIHDYNCGLKLYKKELAKSLHLYGGLHRFIPLLAYQQGFSVSEVLIHHDKRLHGKSKYGPSKVLKDLPDLFTMMFLSLFSQRPLHFFFFIGNFLSLIGIIFLGYLTYLHYFLHETVGTRPLWSVGILFTLVGLQITFTGLLADLIIHTMKGTLSHSDGVQQFIKFSTDKK